MHAGRFAKPVGRPGLAPAHRHPEKEKTMAGDPHIVEVALVEAEQATPVLHRYGRVSIVTPDGAGPRPPDIDDETLTALTDAERLGLQALRMRTTPDFLEAKQSRALDGEPWTNLGSCTTVTPAPDLAAPQFTRALAAGPTSSYLQGSVAVGLVIVDGPTPDLKFTPDQRVKIAAEVQNGLSWYARSNPAAGISFSYAIETPQIDVKPDPHAPDLEGRWRDPAMAAM
jgi:hypothetical protein